MYYYIFEQTKTRSDRIYQEKIRRTLSNLGISGETVVPNPARSVEELVEMGISKGYITIVGIGSDLFANKIISRILNYVDNEEKVVFGFIPQKIKTSKLSARLNVETAQNACEALRYRRVVEQKVGMVNPKRYFLTPLTWGDKDPVRIAITAPAYQIISEANKIKIFSDITVKWENDKLNPSFARQFFSKLFDKTVENCASSQINGDIFALETSPSIPLNLEGEIVAKTPVEIKTAPKNLRLIVNRATISKEGKEK